MFEHERLLARVWLAQGAESPALCARAIAPLEPHVPWEGPFLAFRAGCYRRLGHPLAAKAERELEAFQANVPPGLADRLPASP
jgi:hypothetical protein